MPFNLFITTNDGRTFKTLRSPYDTRQDAATTVHVVLDDQPDVHDFTTRMTSAPLGETVKHEGTGVTFRTEEI